MVSFLVVLVTKIFFWLLLGIGAEIVVIWRRDVLVEHLRLIIEVRADS
jgi:hypothetical protein